MNIFPRLAALPVPRLILAAMLLWPFSLYAESLLDRLSGLLQGQGPAAEDILHPDRAFQLELRPVSPGGLLLSWQIEPGYYLYKDKFQAQSLTNGISVQGLSLPPGKIKADPLFGQVEVYYGRNEAVIPFAATAPDIKIAAIEVGYQGCKEDSICYPPIKKTYTVSLAAAGGPAAPQPALLSEQDGITQRLKDKGLLLNLLAFFGFGLLLAFTPCVFPMIPILSGIIVGEKQQMTRPRAFSLSLGYVLAMALTYAGLGVVAGLFHFNLQAASQNIWALSLFSGLFVLLAFSMFGFYELQLPASWQSRLSGRRARGGALKGAAVMGVLSAVIVGPCVAPPLAGALLYISQTGDAVLGGLALFALGLGFGLPLLLVGAASGEILPRAGAWMETVRRGFGVIMLGVAIWFLERVLPEAVSLMLWATLLVTTAVFMGALDRTDATAGRATRLGKGFGLVLMVYGGALIVAAASGGGTLLRPFAEPRLAAAPAKQSLPFNPVSGPAGLQAALAEARLAGKPVMLDFYADWCVTCVDMETHTFSDPAVRAALQDFILLKTDVTAHNAMDQALLKQLELFGPPAILFFNAEATEIKSHRLVGFIKPEPFIRHIEQALAL